MGAAPVRRIEGVAVACPVTVPYAKSSPRPTLWWLGRAVAGLVEAAGIDKADIDGLIVASYTLGVDGAAAVAEHFGLSLRTLDQLPFGGASGAIAVKRAARAIEAGEAEIVACIAGDTLGGGGFRDLVENFSSFSRDAVLPYGASGPNGVFSLITGNYMTRFGATREDFGKLCVTQRNHAQANPLALLRAPLSLDQYLNARPIAPPLHLFDCVLPCCGAEAFLVMSADRARSLGLEHAAVRAAIERHNANIDPDARTPVQESGGWELEADAFYHAAGYGPGDMHFLQAYDDYPVMVTMQMEDLGFCPKGEGPAFIRRTEFSLDGDLPLNTNGGQLSVGQAGAAGGFLSVTEAVRQLTGRPTGGAVRGARGGAERGVVSGYGTVNYDRGLCASAVLLERGDGRAA